MNIELRTIPHAEQRYDTVGDWQIDQSGKITVSVSDMKNEDYAFMVAIHEAIEVWLCRKRGITEGAVDAFDMAYEDARQEGDESEPGDDPNAPYRKEHFFATTVERMLCAELGIDWKVYDAAVMNCE